MTFRIRHEETNVKIISLVSCLLCFQVISFFCLIAENVDEIPAWLALIFVSILIVLIAGSFLYAIERRPERSSPFRTGRSPSGICSGSSRSLWMRSAIFRSNGISGTGAGLTAACIILYNRKPTVLTDTATTGGNGLFVPTDPIPDDSVPLYQAYLYILSELNRMHAY